MKRIKERTYAKKLAVFIIGFTLGWVFYLFIVAMFNPAEEISDPLGILAAVLSLITMILYFIIGDYNYLKRLELTTNSLLSNISIYKEREKKLLSKAEEIILKFFAHESDIQKSVANVRSRSQMDLNDNLEFTSIKDLKVTVESYPDLKSDKHISKILEQIEQSQDMILHSKLQYNEYVTYYNTGIISFPAILFSGLWKLKPLHFYEDNSDLDLD